jgi:DnaJ family protein C protein 13
MLFFFLRVDDDPETQKHALRVIQAVSVSKDCVNGIADAGALGNLLMLCHSLPSHHETIVETLLALATNPKIVAEAILKGGVIYLLDLFCTSQNPAVRIGAASIFSKMCADKLHGPRVVIIISKFLPPIFHDAMRENAEASVHMYETNHENPELVWDDDARQKVQSVIAEMKTEFFKEQLTNPNAKWDIPNNFEVVYTTVAGEVVVGGVYLKLFIKQPGWSLRNPKQFLVTLFDKYFELAQGSPGEHPIVTVGDAIVLLLTVQSQLPAYTASIGLIAKLFSVMTSRNEFILKTACQIGKLFFLSFFFLRNYSTKPLLSLS